MIPNELFDGEGEIKELFGRCNAPIITLIALRERPENSDKGESPVRLEVRVGTSKEGLIAVAKEVGVEVGKVKVPYVSESNHQLALRGYRLGEAYVDREGIEVNRGKYILKVFNRTLGQ